MLSVNFLNKPFKVCKIKNMFCVEKLEIKWYFNYSKSFGKLCFYYTLQLKLHWNFIFFFLSHVDNKQYKWNLNTCKILFQGFSFLRQLNEWFNYGEGRLFVGYLKGSVLLFKYWHWNEVFWIAMSAGLVSCAYST